MDINKYKPILTGIHVTLRSLKASDAEAMFLSLSDKESMRLTGTQDIFTLEDVKRHCENIESAEDRLDYAITVNGKIIGEVVLNDIDWRNRSANFRIAIWEASNRDRGFGTEAAQLMLDRAFVALKLNRIELEVYAFNPRGLHVYEKLGFQVEGRRRQALWWEGKPVDAIVMGMLKCEYNPITSQDKD